MWYQMANIEVSKFEGDNNWALLIDPDGFITEGTGNNFFIIKDGVIISPEGRNILRGTRREYIFYLASQLDLRIVEKNIEPYDVACADEAFITGTPFCILPVTSFRYRKIGNGEFGEISQKILNQWSKNVGLDIKQQIINYDLSNEDIVTGSTPYKHLK